MSASFFLAGARVQHFHWAPALAFSPYTASRHTELCCAWASSLQTRNRKRSYKVYRPINMAVITPRTHILHTSSQCTAPRHVLMRLNGAFQLHRTSFMLQIPIPTSRQRTRHNRAYSDSLGEIRKLRLWISLLNTQIDHNIYNKY